MLRGELEQRVAVVQNRAAGATAKSAKYQFCAVVAALIAALLAVIATVCAA
jgi:hypothetical protein